MGTVKIVVWSQEPREYSLPGLGSSGWRSKVRWPGLALVFWFRGSQRGVSLLDQGPCLLASSSRPPRPYFLGLGPGAEGQDQLRRPPSSASSLFPHKFEEISQKRVRNPPPPLLLKAAKKSYLICRSPIRMT